MTTNTESVAQVEEIQPVDLGVDDIRNAVIAIDIAANEAGFKTWKTIIDVWNTRSRLVRFIEYAEAQRKAEEAARAEAAPEQTE